jgi:hypothetical protein
MKKTFMAVLGLAVVFGSALAQEISIIPFQGGVYQAGDEASWTISVQWVQALKAGKSLPMK